MIELQSREAIEILSLNILLKITIPSEKHVIGEKNHKSLSICNGDIHDSNFTFPIVVSCNY